MKIEIENLKGLVYLKDLNNYQRSLAINELKRLIDYVNELEQLTIPVVVRTLICVDDSIPNLTRYKEYEMLAETNRHYNLIDDNGNDVLISKSYLREKKLKKDTSVRYADSMSAYCLAAKKKINYNGKV